MYQDKYQSKEIQQKVSHCVAADSTEFIAMRAGRGLLYHGKAATIDETIERIMQVTPDEIAQAATYLTAERLSSLTYR